MGRLNLGLSDIATAPHGTSPAVETQLLEPRIEPHEIKSCKHLDGYLQ